VTLLLTRKFTYNRFSDVSLLSVDSLDSLLLSESFMIDSEDSLVQILFPPAIRPFFATSDGHL
jgi:hypothetical protein